MLTIKGKMGVMVSMTAQPCTKILLIEDDLLTAEIIEESLVQAGYAVKHAANVDDGHKMIDSWDPRLVITDHDMPGRSGLELLCELRKKQNYVTVIFVSGRKDTGVVVKALEEGADDYIEKPFRVPELLARVKVALRNNEIHRELADKNEQLEAMVEIDDLTGLYNMRSIYDKVDREIARSRRKEVKLAIIMMDMDHFKTVNDENDHLFGSFVLKEVGRIILDNIREYDFGARYGGDEFLICLTEVTEDGVMKFCDRLRRNIAAYTFDDGKNQMNLTCSIGAALVTGDSKINARELVRQADHALYDSKDSGRNQTSLRLTGDVKRQSSAS